MERGDALEITNYAMDCFHLGGKNAIVTGGNTGLEASSTRVSTRSGRSTS
jgi:hypothetical protein